jgi:hypothetical protein
LKIKLSLRLFPQKISIYMEEDLMQPTNFQAQTPFVASLGADTSQISPQALVRQRLFSKTKRKAVSEEERKEVELKLSILEGEIEADIKLYEKRSRLKGRGAFFFRFLSTALAAVITVLMGINLTIFDNMENIRTPLGQPLSWYANTIAIMISAFLTVIGALRTFFDSNELWVVYTDTVSQLTQLLEDIQYIKIGFNYCTLDDVNLLNLEYARIKEEAENTRLRLRMDDYGKN